METQAKVYSSDTGEIIVPDCRQRKTIDESKIKQLANSIERVGQITPGYCKREGTDIILIAGHRRLLACAKANLPYQFILKEDVTDPALLYEIELEENVCRENLPWKEEAAARAELHRLYSETKGSSTPGSSQRWNLRKSAEEMHISLGSLSEDVELAEWAKQVPEVAQAKNRSEAKKIVKRYKDTAIQQKTLQTIAAAAKPSSPSEPPPSDPKEAAMQRMSLALEEFNKNIFEQRMEDFLEPGSQTYDIVFFDPPWGVNFNSVFQNSATRQAYSDEQQDFFSSFPNWVKLLYSVMSENSHLYLKFGIIHHEFVYRSLTEAGFSTEGIPIIWHKRGSHRTRQPQLWPGRSYEPIAFARKGSKPLQRQGAPNIIETPPCPPSAKGIHPSAMHPDLPRELLLRSGFPGNRVLDPMAGSGMTGVACESLRSQLGLSYTLIEMSPQYCDLIRKNLLRGYASIINSPTESESVDYTSVTPGSPEWMKIWTSNPELHEEMMEFSKTNTH